MQHIDGEDFKVAKDYKDLIFAVLEIINRRIKHYQNLELHILVEHNSK